LSGPSGSRSPDNVKLETRRRTSASRSSPASFWTCRRSFRTSCRSSSSVKFRHVQTDHHGRRGAEPPSRGRPRNAEVSCDGRVHCALDELAQPMVVALLRTGRCHATDHRLSDHRRSTALRENGASPLWDDRRARATRVQKCRMSMGTAPKDLRTCHLPVAA